MRNFSSVGNLEANWMILLIIPLFQFFLMLSGMLWENLSPFCIILRTLPSFFITFWLTSNNRRGGDTKELQRPDCFYNESGIMDLSTDLLTRTLVKFTQLLTWIRIWQQNYALLHSFFRLIFSHFFPLFPLFPPLPLAFSWFEILASPGRNSSSGAPHCLCEEFHCFLPGSSFPVILIAKRRLHLFRTSSYLWMRFWFTYL